MTTGALGEDPLSRAEIERLLADAKARNLPWQGPRMFRPSYFAGYDVLEVAQAMPQADDAAILALAVQESRIVITNDKDFGEKVFRERRAHR